MKLIHKNYLLLTKQSDFNNNLLKYFYERLCLFLCTESTLCPKVVFTSNIKKIAEIYDDPNETSYGRAFYDEEKNIVVFDANKYNIKSPDFAYWRENIEEEIGQVDMKYKYVVPISDIYHELVHAKQFFSGFYDHTDFVEACDEIFVYFITGQYNIDYYKQSISLWYVARILLKLDINQLYTFIRDCIINNDFVGGYFLSNKHFIKILAKDYNGIFNKFMIRFKVDFYIKDYEVQFERELDYIHNLIFYKY